VIKDETEVAGLPKLKKTALSFRKQRSKSKTFFDTAEAVKAKTDDEVEIVNTICSATRDRQEAARALAGMVDAFYIYRRSAFFEQREASCRLQRTM
jgi:4-hydroxy-3-methylbut-2-enyl diphosphate reductase IspH